MRCDNCTSIKVGIVIMLSHTEAAVQNQWVGVAGRHSQLSRCCNNVYCSTDVFLNDVRIRF